MRPIAKILLVIMAKIFVAVALMLFRWTIMILKSTSLMKSTNAMCVIVEEDLHTKSSSLALQTNTALDLVNAPVGYTRPKLFLVFT